MKIVIIGAGVSGLAAGIYARRQGFECEIYEQHTIAGGECTYWKRQGYTIDNCVHWMTGTNPSSELYGVWEEVGVLGNGKEVIQNESFLHVECPEGQIDLWEDEERLRQDMLAISPEDKDAIEEFILAIRLYKDFELPAKKPMEQMSLLEIFRMLRRFRKLGKVHGKYALMPMPTLADKFKHPLLKKAILAYMPDFYNASSFFYVLGTFDSGNGALPKGGSAAISDNMLKTYLDLGGKIFYRKKASRFNIEKKRAVSVSFEDGTTVGADYFVAACD
ncbi:MAG: NAD(P)/FAD-dependent oxidoreductase, partial [Paludibacteraceae bacterium]|nr:NAD(P)/FAD-dependent oxidoreductase [Paludibacteraceae bacterium]